ncbi:MAG: hypothetical protein GX951_03495 [Mollicutes bacterium]|nr:hypothetical protein [Mollicutes bacterium]
MKKDNYVVTNFPIAPFTKEKTARLTSIILSKLISEKLKIKNILSINLLHSFKNKKTNGFIKFLNEIQLTFDDYFIDNDNINIIIEKIQRLYDEKIIIEKSETIIQCDCGLIDFPKKALKYYNNKLFKKINNKYICTKCKKGCQEKKEKRLFLKISPRYIKKIKCIPQLYNNNFQQFNEYYSKQELLISKSRKTGVMFKDYNLDIDFFWSLFLTTFNEENIIAVICNKHLFNIYIVDYLAHIFHKKVIYLIHPYIENKENIVLEKEVFKYDHLFMKLYFIYNNKWFSSESSFNKGMLKYLAKKRKIGREKLYNKIIQEEEYIDIYEFLNEYLKKQLIFQKDIYKIKT